MATTSASGSGSAVGANRFALTSPVLHDLLVLSLTLFAPFAVAANQLGGQAVLVLGLGALLWLSPPERKLDVKILAVLAALAAWPLLTLLPPTWLGPAPWHRALGELNVALPFTYSPQPWLTFENALLLLSGLVWAAYLLTRRWHLSRRELLPLFALGVGALAAVWLVMAVLAPAPAPGETRPFGFFPNRNQSADFLAVGGVALAGLCAYAWRDRSRRVPLWIGTLVVVLLALLRDGSRAGLLLFAAGSLGWFLTAGKMVVPAHRRWWGAVACVLVLLTIAFLAGGPVVERLTRSETGAGEHADDFRLKIYRDALNLTHDAGWTGAGLGNFSPLFPRYRTTSMTSSRAIHPESDWFWVLAEMGWPAVLLLAALVALVLWRCLPFAEGTDRVLRSAAFAAVVAFLAHSFVDVSGHRVGTLWPALFLLALATPGGLGVRTEGTLRPRLLGTGFVLLGLAWLISAFGFVKLPTSAEYLRLKRQMSAALDAKKYPEGAALAAEALRLAPLDWELHFGRGAALAASVRVTSPAVSNFTVVRWLEPVGRVGYEEGRAWLIREGSTKESDFWFGPEARLAADAWRAALATDPRSANGLFGSMLSTALEHPDIRPYMKDLAIGDRRREFEFLGSTSGADFAEVLTSLLRGDPGLKGFKPEEQRLVFRLWAQRGDVRELGRAMEANPAWLALGWDSVGEVLARQGDFKTACELARRYYPKPEMPPVPTRSAASLREDFVSNRKDVGAGIYYFMALRASGEHKEALEVIRYINSQPDAPGYFFALEGEEWFELKNYESAWRAWQVAAGR